MQIVNWNQISEVQKKEISARGVSETQDTIKIGTTEIIQQVKSGGDTALIQLTKQFDRVELSSLAVTEAEFSETKNLDPAVLAAINFAKTQIETYHRAQLPQNQTIQTCEGVVCERQVRSISRVGLYIPGGSAPLVSTVLMLAVPAQLANCATRILATPVDANGKVNPYILAAAQLCGIEKIYKLGGAQAIAAMAYGTETIPKVDKIFGPGNAWVTQAKMQVAQDPAGASIDMPAGPSEIMIIADEEANPSFIAADLLSQAEHGVDSQAMLIVLSKKMAEQVLQQIQQQLIQLPRIEIAKKALQHSRIMVVDTIETAIDISNRYAPEHLILQIENPTKYTSMIENAGAVFLGPWTPETVGDYVTGSNHVLPTYGYAKTYSGLSLGDFMKYISFQQVSALGLRKIGPYAETLASIEGLTAHKEAVSLRLRQLESLCEV